MSTIAIEQKITSKFYPWVLELTCQKATHTNETRDLLGQWLWLAIKNSLLYHALTSIADGNLLLGDIGLQLQ